jgi:hypothetical protein
MTLENLLRISTLKTRTVTGVVEEFRPRCR